MTEGREGLNSQLIMLAPHCPTDTVTSDGAEQFPVAWKVAIADADPAVSTHIQPILESLTVAGRSVEVLTAHSYAEAQALIATQPDILLLILSAQLGSDERAIQNHDIKNRAIKNRAINNNGLALARHLRHEQQNQTTQIVLRLATADCLPSELAILECGLTDCCQLQDLTPEKLLMLLAGSVRSYQAAIALQATRRTLQTCYQQTNAALQNSANELRQQNAVLLDLARNKALHQGDLQAALAEATRALAETLKIERVGVWLYDETGTQLHCHDLFERSQATHSNSLAITINDYPRYFQALADNQLIAANDAYTDPRTQEFATHYLPAHRISSLLDAPICLGGQIVGVLCSEQVGSPRHWTAEEQNFARSVADLLSLMLETRERKRTEEELRQSEECFRAITEANPLPFVITRFADGIILDGNQQLGETFGLPNGDFIGRQSSDFYFNPNDRSTFIHNLKQHGHLHDYEMQVKRADGTIFWVVLSSRI